MKNRIENPLFYKCNKNNELVIDELMKKRGANMTNLVNMNNNVANFNLHPSTSDKNSLSVQEQPPKERESKK